MANVNKIRKTELILYGYGNRTIIKIGSFELKIIKPYIPEEIAKILNKSKIEFKGNVDKINYINLRRKRKRKK